MHIYVINPSKCAETKCKAKMVHASNLLNLLQSPAPLLAHHQPNVSQSTLDSHCSRPDQLHIRHAGLYLIHTSNLSHIGRTTCSHVWSCSCVSRVFPLAASTEAYFVHYLSHCLSTDNPCVRIMYLSVSQSKAGKRSYFLMAVTFFLNLHRKVVYCCIRQSQELKAQLWECCDGVL